MILDVLIFAAGVSAGVGGTVAYFKYFGQAKGAALSLEAAARAAFAAKLALVEKAIADLKASL